MYFASLVAASVLSPGNSMFGELYATTPGGAAGNPVRGIVFEAYSAAAAAALTIGHVRYCQVNAFGRSLISQTATFNGTSTVAVTDGTKFLVGMPVTFTTTGRASRRASPTTCSPSRGTTSRWGSASTLPPRLSRRAAAR